MAATRVAFGLLLILILLAFTSRLLKTEVLQQQVKGLNSLAALSFEHRTIKGELKGNFK